MMDYQYEGLVMQAISLFDEYINMNKLGLPDPNSQCTLEITHENELDGYRKLKVGIVINHYIVLHDTISFNINNESEQSVRELLFQKVYYQILLHGLSNMYQSTKSLNKDEHTK